MVVMWLARCRDSNSVVIFQLFLVTFCDSIPIASVMLFHFFILLHNQGYTCMDSPYPSLIIKEEQPISSKLTAFQRILNLKSLSLYSLYKLHWLQNIIYRYELRLISYEQPTTM